MYEPTDVVLGSDSAEIAAEEDDDTASRPEPASTDTDKIVLSQPPLYILPLIVYSQFAGTSLWFAGNAVIGVQIEEFDLPPSSLSILTSAVQAGFIIGTLLSAVTNLVDRFRPNRVFLSAALLGAILNALIPLIARHLAGLTILRLLTGVALAGIYPVGMKIAADWHQQGLGRALGFLVGALVLGTAFPFLLRQIQQPWQWLLWETSLLAASGRLCLGCLPNGPYRRASTCQKPFDPSVIGRLFAEADFRAAAFGYFGHMWELYAFWAWTPVVWSEYVQERGSDLAVDLMVFCIIAMGAVGCVVGGLLSPKVGSARVAVAALVTSGLACFLSPAVYLGPPPLMIVFYLIWGTAVAADSPQFSSLVAMSAPDENKGTALTIVNCIGFAITIGSIYLLGVPLDAQYLFLLLAPGPVFGVWSMRRRVLRP